MSDDCSELVKKINENLSDWTDIVEQLDGDELSKFLTLHPPQRVVRDTVEIDLIEASDVEGGPAIQKDKEDTVDQPHEVKEFKEDLENTEPENKDQESPPSPGEVQEKKGEWTEPDEWLEVDISDVSGVGPKTEENIKKGFNDPEDILTAGSKELQKVDGVGKSTAEAVINKLESYYNDSSLSGKPEDELDEVPEEEIENPEELETEEETPRADDDVEESDDINDEEVQFASDDGFYETDEESLEEFSDEPEDQETPRVDDRKHNPDIAEIAQNQDLSEEEIQDLQQYA